MNDFKFKIGEEVMIINVNGNLHNSERSIIDKSIGSILLIKEINYNINDNHYCLNFTSILGPYWWFHEDNLEKVNKGLDTKSIINKVFTGRNYD